LRKKDDNRSGGIYIPDTTFTINTEKIIMTDLAIIGGGLAGYVAAERAGAKGLSVTLFEKNNCNP